MSVDEISRIRLARRAVEVFGEAEAATLMEHLPLGGVSNLATKDDLKILGAELRLEMSELRSELRGEMSDLRIELRGEMSEIRADFGTLRGEFGTLRGEFGELRAYIDERFHRQTITMITTMSALMGILFVALKWA